MAQIPANTGIPDVAPDTRAPQDYQNVTPKAAEGLQQLGQGASKFGQFWGEVQTDGAINDAMTKVNTTLDQYRQLRGADALNAQGPTEQAVNEAFAEGRNGLNSPAQQYQYDNTTRMYQQRYVAGIIASHAAQQGYEHATQVNGDSLKVALTNVTSVADDDAHVEMFLHDARDAMIKQNAVEGNSGDPKAVQAAISRADQAVYKTQAETVAVHDPVRALALVEQHKAELGPVYAQLADQFRARANLQAGINLSNGTSPIANPQQPSNSGPSNPNNIGNVKTSYGAQSGTADFVQPATPVDGVMLAANTLRSGYQGLTIAQIGQKWEGTSNYPTWVANVAKATGMDINSIPNLNDPAQLTTLISGIGVAEKSPADRVSFTPDVVQQGVQASLSGQHPQTLPPSLLAGQLQRIQASGASPEVQQYAIQHAEQQERIRQITADQTDHARKTANEDAANEWSKKIEANPNSDILQQMNADPRLTDWRTREALTGLLENRTGFEDVRKFGPGYSSAYSAIFAPPDDPTKITDINAILRQGAPGGSLTPIGAQKLVQVFTESRKSADETGIHTTASSLLTYAKDQLSFQEDTGPVKIPDRNGEAIFHAQLVPKFEAALSTWRLSGKDPMQFLTKKNVDEMMQGMRSRADMANDRLAATGQLAPEDVDQPGTPIPPAPEGLNAGEWSSIMSAPPKSQSGQPYTHAAWAEVMRRLVADPERAVPFFDRRFGLAGYNGAEFVKRLKTPSTPPPGYVPAVAMPF